MSGRLPVVSVLDPARVARVQIAHEEYHATDSGAYDEALLEVSERVEERGSVGKADIGALVLWKRMRADTRWARSLSLMTDAAVRQITGEAVTAVRDARLATPEAAGRGRAALGKLPGFARGDALASALLVAAAPDRMAVYDRRAQAGLEMLGLVLTPAEGRYRRYMALVEDIRADVGLRHGRAWTARDVDLALYWIGG